MSPETIESSLRLIGMVKVPHFDKNTMKTEDGGSCAGCVSQQFKHGASTAMETSVTRCRQCSTDKEPRAGAFKNNVTYPPWAALRMCLCFSN